MCTAPADKWWRVTRGTRTVAHLTLAYGGVGAVRTPVGLVPRVALLVLAHGRAARGRVLTVLALECERCRARGGSGRGCSKGAEC